jgi:hypothetical protein
MFGIKAIAFAWLHLLSKICQTAVGLPNPIFCQAVFRLIKLQKNKFFSTDTPICSTDLSCDCKKNRFFENSKIMSANGLKLEIGATRDI